MLLYLSIFILLKGIYMEISEKRLLDVLRDSMRKFWELGLVCRTYQQDIEISSETEEMIERIIKKYPKEFDYLTSYPNWSDGYYFGLFVSMEFCINLITDGENLTRKNSSRVGFS